MEDEGEKEIQGVVGEWEVMAGVGSGGSALNSCLLLALGTCAENGQKITFRQF